MPEKSQGENVDDSIARSRKLLRQVADVRPSYGVAWGLLPLHPDTVFLDCPRVEPSDKPVQPKDNR